MRLIDAPDLSRHAERRGGWLSSLPLRRDVDSDPPHGHADEFEDYGSLRELGVRVEGAGLSGTGAGERKAA